VYGIILLLVVAMLSLVITRIATIALTATGMSQPSARFQARSALTGVGFTTTESEAVVAHPARRRIIMALMLTGSVGLATSIGGALARYTDLEVRDYAALLHVSGEYEVKEMLADAESWLAGRTLGDLRLKDEGVLVLGVVRSDGSYLGVPNRDTRIEAGDVVILYGRDEVFAELTARPRGPEGDAAHARAVTDQNEMAEREEDDDDDLNGARAG